MKKIFLLIPFLMFFISINAQSNKDLVLARQYYNNGDYEKASQLFYELWKNDNNNEYYYTSLLYSYIRLKEFNEAEKIVKKQIKKSKENLNYQIDLGYVYSQNNDAAAAEKEYENVLNQLVADQNQIRQVASKFLNIQQTDYAIKTYLKGRKLLNTNDLFVYELGNAYFKENKNKEAVQTYLDLLQSNPNNIVTVQSILANKLDKEEVQDELETQLYTLVQKKPNESTYAEMLIWLFSHQQDYEQALIQAKALDKRNNEDGNRIFQLANNAFQEKQYDTAIDAYKYLIENKKDNSTLRRAKALLIRSEQEKITSRPNYTVEQINALQNNYTNYLNTYGKGIENVDVISNFAHLQAYYIHNLSQAITLLEEAISLPNIPKKTKNTLKLELGDIYILDDNVWEATLLYAQVDKDEKDSPIGEDARFRNAKLSYYKGEFEWSQAQLKILKGATTELIANDAIDLSVFIMDNLGLDSITTTMEEYSNAELLALQNKDEEALQTLDNILKDYPGHALTDDIYYKKAQIYFSKNNYEKAVEMLNAILLNHKEDILADNAAFMLGDIYQNYLMDKEKAMKYYKLIITDYSGSVLLVEARKRYRTLRGDNI